MTRLQAIRKYRDKITADMVECYKAVIESNGSIQYRLYVWEDGELEHLLEPQGGNGWLKPRDMEPRKLFYVTTIGESSSFCIWDFAENGIPEDYTERDNLREEIIDWLVGGYEDSVADVIDAIEDEAEYEDELE